MGKDWLGFLFFFLIFLLFNEINFSQFTVGLSSIDLLYCYGFSDNTEAVSQGSVISF